MRHAWLPRPQVLRYTAHNMRPQVLVVHELLSEQVRQHATRHAMLCSTRRRDMQCWPLGSKLQMKPWPTTRACHWLTGPPTMHACRAWRMLGTRSGSGCQANRLAACVHGCMQDVQAAYAAAASGTVLLAGCPVASLGAMLQHPHLPLLLGAPYLPAGSQSPALAYVPAFGSALEATAPPPPRGQQLAGRPEPSSGRAGQPTWYAECILKWHRGAMRWHITSHHITGCGTGCGTGLRCDVM